MTTRQFAFPKPGDDLESIASRELPDSENAVDQLLSWNHHLAARRSMGVLPCDIVFLEPPVA